MPPPPRFVNLHRRIGIAAVAVCLVGAFAASMLLAGPAAAASDNGSDVSVTRYGGADRYVTSLQIAEAVAADAGGSLDWVVLVSGQRWTDAVVAAPVAGALGAPVLMTPPGELSADALGFLLRAGITKAVVVGPDASGGGHGPGQGVGAEVLEALSEAGIFAERVADDDRFGTGVAAAGRVTPGAMGELGRTAVIASGEVFADALVAGPFAARGIHPVLLTPPGELHADVADYLGEAAIEHVVLMGGTAALSGEVEQSVKELDIAVTRVAGATRYDTAVKAAELVDGRYSDTVGRSCFATGTIGVARARVPFDSFSAAPLLGRLCAPLVLADPGEIPPDTAGFLDAARKSHDALGLQVFGGDAAVSQASIDTYLSAALSVLDHDACRPPSIEGVRTTVGFPIPERADPSSGTVKITVLFMDFPDAQAAHTTQAEIDPGLRIMEEYLEAQSYGNLDLVIDVVHKWWRSPSGYRTYLAPDAGDNPALWPSADAAAVRLADDSYDFSDTDVVLTVFPSNHFGGGNGLGRAHADGTDLSSFRVNSQPARSKGEPWNWGLTAAHELAHNLGLLDLYPFDASLHAAENPPPGDAWVYVEIGLMGLRARYADPDHSLWLVTPVEMLSWSRWQLGWLEPQQVACGVRSGRTVRLRPIARPGTGTAAVIVPLSDDEMIVVESRRKLGYDATAPDTHQNGAMLRHGLLEEGVLVYTVDSRIGNGQLPIKVAGDTGNSQVDNSPVLQTGEAITVRDYTIVVTADDGGTHSVQITRDR